MFASILLTSVPAWKRMGRQVGTNGYSAETEAWTEDSRLWWKDRSLSGLCKSDIQHLMVRSIGYVLEEHAL